MATKALCIGIVGAGDNTRKRHIPGLRAIPNVEITALCNRRPQSTAEVAKEFGIPQTYSHWRDLIADPRIDAVVIGTWPYLHCPITLAALQAGKHVLCEARMAMNADEARQMLDESRKHPELVAQIVPSPFGLRGDATMRRLIAEGYLGDLRELQILALNGALADPSAPLSWRQDAALSGVNMLLLGIVHETLIRWVPSPVHVHAQAHAFVPERVDPESGLRRKVGTPDSVQVLTVLPNGARVTYHFSGAVPVGGHSAISLYGTQGALRYDLNNERIVGMRRGQPEFEEIPIPDHETGGWRVEADFIESIRDKKPVRFTDFETGVRYMEFTEAVARSVESR